MKESQIANVQPLLCSIALSLWLTTPLPAQNTGADEVGKVDLETRMGRLTAVSLAPHAAPEEGLIVREYQLDRPGGHHSRGGPVYGSQRYVTILCRYADIPDTPEPVSYFEGFMLDNAPPGLNHYFRELSYNLIDLDGSIVVGWYDLPQPWSYYNHDTNGDGIYFMDLERVIPDCIAVADADVNFLLYSGINFFFNESATCRDILQPCGGAGGAPNWPIFAEGFTLFFDIVVTGPWGYHHQAVLAHEMLHGMAVPHSSCAYDQTYDSAWDAVSGAGICPNPDPPPEPYGCLSVHTIAFHKDKLGGISDDRRYDTGSSGAAVITIERLALPPLLPGNYLMGKLRIGGSSTRFYTVEVRRFTGYDGSEPGPGAIPGETVLIHDVDTNRGDRWAQVVDSDGNGDCNDDGAMWEPGETFVDSANQIVMHVETSGASSAVVSLTNQARDPVYVWGGATGYEDGSPEDPWNTVTEGYAGVYPNGTVFIFPGNYPETLTMSKPCRLERSYGAEPVIIGE